jgi:hypothetical protein
MARNQQEGSLGGRRRGAPGAVSRWVQQRMNARMNRNIRRGRGRFLGMDVDRIARPRRRGGETPQRLDGADRVQAWQRITAAQPRYAKYQRKTDREYPVVRLTLQ